MIQNPHGFYLFVRGDRSAIAGGPYGTTTLRSRGKIFVNPTVPLITNDFNSIGNPLASEIDLRQLQLTTSSITTATKFYLWDPTLPGSHNIGATKRSHLMEMILKLLPEVAAFLFTLQAVQ